MANIDMKTLTIGENTYIIIDAGARTLIGDLSNLDTTAKNNLVAAINELFQGGGGSSVEPYTSDPADLGSSASPGSSNKFSRGDHVHKKPTPADIGAGTYSKPSGGIPKTDLASAVQTSLGKADSAYQKPSGGVPKTDLASAVQTSLGKADSALQSVPSTYRTAAAQDTIDAEKISMPSGGSTGQFLQKTASGTQWATPSGGGSGPSPYDLLPQMDGAASAGSSAGFSRGDHRHPSDTSKADKWAYEEIDDDGAVTLALSKETYYDFTSSSLTSLTLTLDDEDTDHYHLVFYAPTAITVTMPSGVIMPSGFQIEADTWYEIDILRGLGVVQSWPGT